MLLTVIIATLSDVSLLIYELSASCEKAGYRNWLQWFVTTSSEDDYWQLRTVTPHYYTANAIILYLIDEVEAENFCFILIYIDDKQLLSRFIISIFSVRSQYRLNNEPTNWQKCPKAIRVLPDKYRLFYIMLFFSILVCTKLPL